MIRRSLDVRTDPTRAFRAWTEHIHLWWPRGHTRHRGTVVLSADQFVERWEGGDDPLGRVVVWEPPVRLVYDFFPGSSAEQPTRVTIQFAASEQGTRVDIQHVRHLVPQERFERSATGFLRAWPEVEAAYLQFLETP